VFCRLDVGVIRRNNLLSYDINMFVSTLLAKWRKIKEWALSSSTGKLTT
jgi:hypothetical protein